MCLISELSYNTNTVSVSYTAENKKMFKLKTNIQHDVLNYIHLSKL